jgi:hypothetical protein
LASKTINLEIFQLLTTGLIEVYLLDNLMQVLKFLVVVLNLEMIASILSRNLLVLETIQLKEWVAIEMKWNYWKRISRNTFIVKINIKSNPNIHPDPIITLIITIKKSLRVLAYKVQ